MIANSPRAMLERLAFLCFLVLLVGSCGLTGLGLIFGLHGGDPRPACLGVAGLLVFVAVRPFGYRHLRFREWEDSFDVVEGRLDFDPVQEARAGELAEVLRELAALRAGGADVWAVQEARQRAAELLAANPELREVFAAELAEHPDLGGSA